MIKIAIVIDSIHLGGPGNVLRTMIHNFDLSRLDVTLITLFKKRNDNWIIDEFKNMGIKVIMLNYANKINYIIHGRRDLKKISEEYSFDIIHSHGFCPDVLNARTHGKARKISTLHCVVYEDYPKFYGKFTSSFLIPTHLHYLKKIETVICCSKSVRDATPCLKHTDYIQNGNTCSHYDIKFDRTSIGLSEDSVIYVYAGQLRARKNIVWLIKQFKQHHKHNEYLLVLGRGDQLEECLNNTDDNIKIIGFSNDVHTYFELSDIYVSASTSEGFSISLLEALDSGLGLFVSDIPSHKEVFDIDDTLYLGETFNEDNFEEKLEQLRNNRNRLLPDKIKHFKHENLSAKKMVENYMKVYEKIYEEKLS